MMWSSSFIKIKIWYRYKSYFKLFFSFHFGISLRKNRYKSRPNEKNTDCRLEFSPFSKLIGTWHRHGIHGIAMIKANDGNTHSTLIDFEFARPSSGPADLYCVVYLLYGWKLCEYCRNRKMAYHYVVTAQKPTAVTSCVTGKMLNLIVFS